METKVDDVFWSAFSKGDTHAFRQLYDLYIDDLFAYGRKYTRDTEMVKDAIHDLFLDLYRYRENLSRPSCVRAYLLSALRRKIWRKLQARPQHMSLEEAGQSPAFSIAVNPESHYIDAEEQHAGNPNLNRALGALSSRQKEAIYLKYHAELPYTEIAAIMGVSVATCRTLVYRGIKVLRDSLEKTQKIALVHSKMGFQVIYLLLILNSIAP